MLWKKISCFDSLSQQREALSLHLSQHLMQVINCREQHSMCRANYLSLNRLQNLHFVNICPQWRRRCKCHRRRRWHRRLQQGNWYSTAEGFQQCKKGKFMCCTTLWQICKHYMEVLFYLHYQLCIGYCFILQKCWAIALSSTEYTVRLIFIQENLFRTHTYTLCSIIDLMNWKSA